MNDNEYMRRVRAAEQKLYRIAQAMLWRPADCADAVQEAVFRGWMKRGSLREEAYFETWLIRILINACKDILRRRSREGAQLPEGMGSEERLCENLHLRQVLIDILKAQLGLTDEYIEENRLTNYAVACLYVPNEKQETAGGNTDAAEGSRLFPAAEEAM